MPVDYQIRAARYEGLRSPVERPHIQDVRAFDIGVSIFRSGVVRDHRAQMRRQRAGHLYRKATKTKRAARRRGRRSFE